MSSQLKTNVLMFWRQVSSCLKTIVLKQISRDGGMGFQKITKYFFSIMFLLFHCILEPGSEPRFSQQVISTHDIVSHAAQLQTDCMKGSGLMWQNVCLEVYWVNSVFWKLEFNSVMLVLKEHKRQNAVVYLLHPPQIFEGEEPHQWGCEI